MKHSQSLRRNAIRLPWRAHLHCMRVSSCRCCCGGCCRKCPSSCRNSQQTHLTVCTPSLPRTEDWRRASRFSGPSTALFAYNRNRMRVANAIRLSSCHAHVYCMRASSRHCCCCGCCRECPSSCRNVALFAQCSAHAVYMLSIILWGRLFR